MLPPSESLAREPGHQTILEQHHWIQSIRHHFVSSADRFAIRTSKETLTYQELGDKVAGVVQMLHQHGVGKGTRIGTGFQRGTDLVISLLAIIESGASYIPIDPDYPPERINQMISSAGLHWILTNRSWKTAPSDVKMLHIEDAGTDVLLPAPAIDDSQPVYAIFTSGSTGTPKAASVFHSGFGNLLKWYREELQIGADDTTLVISSPSFDLTQKNLFTPLITGGTLVFDDSGTYDITRISSLIRDHGVTIINCTPSAFYPLMEAAEGTDFQAISSLRFAILGGEPISIPRVRSWLAHPSCKAEIVNSYGPTECTDICLFHRLHRNNLDEFPFVPLGREIPNVEVTIRDESLAPLPEGEVGELCIAGAGLGSGYLNDPQRTAERFVNGIYRSGDLAKRLPCGTFEFRGRADHQVKVNGYRIELGEIEIALNDHESVTEAIVTTADNQLIAHICGDATAADLRSHLSQRLPQYMIPSHFVFVDSFPLTPNGKVDRKALQGFPSHKTKPESSQHPENLESRILALWSELLGATITDPLANFFDLGGNSIHLAVMHVRLIRMCGKDFPITDLFAMPNARSIASHLGGSTSDASSSAAQQRALRAKAGFSRFQRPSTR